MRRTEEERIRVAGGRKGRMRGFEKQGGGAGGDLRNGSIDEG